MNAVTKIEEGFDLDQELNPERIFPDLGRSVFFSVMKGQDAFMPEGGDFGLLYCSIDNFFAFERAYGSSMREHVLKLLGSALRECGRKFLGDVAFIHLERLENGSMFVVLRHEGLELQNLADLAMTIRLTVRRNLNQEVVQLTGQRLEIKMGYSKLREPKGSLATGVLYQALCDARQVADGSLNFSKLRLMEEFRQIIEAPRLTAFYQPIVDLKTGRILGWEALARGPAGSRFQSPGVLFSFAEEVGSLFSLERACRLMAIQGVGPIDKDQKLFLNIHPHTVGDPTFTAGETRRLLERYGLSPENVVFEITERHPIRDFTFFFRTLEHYRAQGYLVAIDDVGAGYSGLWNLGQIRPHFIKVDMALVRGVDANPVNRALVEILVQFADKMGSKVIAEGIETETELTSLMDMGVHYGQGFFLARPERPKPSPKRTLPFRPVASVQELAGARCSIPIGELAEPALQMGPEVKTSEVQTLLENSPPSPITGVVVVEDERPLGIVMSYELNRQLGTLYGVALYYDRSILKLMDSAPLIFEENVPVEIVAERAMARERHKVYDHILVTRGGKLVGVVSVQKMLDTLARVHLEMAKGANPLTGLPGNVAIEKEVERRSAEGRFTSLIYADLDHFKVYNDLYGFEAGDRMILLISRVLCWAAKRHGGSEAYVGHVGGDDFILMTTPEHSERVARGITRVFARLVSGLYCPEDRERGFVLGRNRDGQARNFHLTSVSLAIVDCQGHYDMGRIAQRAAEMKKFAKSKPGNVFVRDRRLPVGLEDSRG